MSNDKSRECQRKHDTTRKRHKTESNTYNIIRIFHVYEVRIERSVRGSVFGITKLAE